jgi:hypothetical protein
VCGRVGRRPIIPRKSPSENWGFFAFLRFPWRTFLVYPLTQPEVETEHTMKRYLAVSAALFLSSFAGFAQTAAAHKGSALQVHVKYTGSGTVDQAHKIYVALWDSPDFVKPSSNLEPFAVAPLTSKSGTVNYQDVAHNPVYVSMAYDPTGKWDAQEEPPTGTSLGLYATTPGIPAPVQLEPGKTTKISATLDDSLKKGMAGQP